MNKGDVLNPKSKIVSQDGFCCKGRYSETYGQFEEMAAAIRRDESEICPGTSDGDEVYGYQIYCGAVIDPSNADDTILPANTQVMNLQDCLTLCDNTHECAGLSYIEESTTCK